MLILHIIEGPTWDSPHLSSCHSLSSSAALLCAILNAMSLLSSLSVTKTQNHVIISTNAHVNTTLFFSPSPQELAWYVFCA